MSKGLRPKNTCSCSFIPLKTLGYIGPSFFSNIYFPLRFLHTQNMNASHNYLAVISKSAVFGRFFPHCVFPQIIHTPCMRKIEKIHSSNILQAFHLPPPPPKGHLGIKSSWFKFTNILLILLHKSIHTSNNNSFLQSGHPSSNLHLQASPPLAHFRG